MPDHCHALISFQRDRAMKKVIANWKEVVAKQTGVGWQRDFFDHRLRNDEGYEEKAHYIRLNPVRQNLVATPEHWRFVWEPEGSLTTDGGPSGPALPSG
jgi:putative transposase